MTNRRRLAFDSSFIVRRSSFVIPIKPEALDETLSTPARGLRARRDPFQARRLLLGHEREQRERRERERELGRVADSGRSDALAGRAPAEDQRPDGAARRAGRGRAEALDSRAEGRRDRHRARTSSSSSRSRATSRATSRTKTLRPAWATTSTSYSTTSPTRLTTTSGMSLRAAQRLRGPAHHTRLRLAPVARELQERRLVPDGLVHGEGRRRRVAADDDRRRPEDGRQL